MTTTNPPDVDVYRVNIRITATGTNATGTTRTRSIFARTYQAEWPECELAPRAYTFAGIIRKARRWQSSPQLQPFRVWRHRRIVAPLLRSMNATTTSAATR